MQAIVGEPPMLPFLEQAILLDAGNPRIPMDGIAGLLVDSRWRDATPAALEIGAGPLVQMSTLQLWCAKGKQQAKRGSAPALFANGFGRAAAMLKAKRELPAEAAQEWHSVQCHGRSRNVKPAAIRFAGPCPR